MRPDFTKVNPNDPSKKWVMLHTWTFTLYQVITSDGREEPSLPIGRTPTHEEDAACDKWFRKVFGQKTIGPKDSPTPHLAPWLWARVLALESFIDEQIENNGLAPQYPDMKVALIDLLITRWPTEMVKRWAEFTYDGTEICHRGEMLLFRPGRNHGGQIALPGEEDITAVSWKNVHNLAEMLAAGTSKLINRQLPFGQKPTPEMDRRCDKWMKDFFASDNPQRMFEKNLPKEITPWIAARFIMATAIAEGNMQTNPSRPDADSVAEIVQYLVTDLWNEKLKNLWLNYSMAPDGRLRYDGPEVIDPSRPKGINFLPN